MVTTTRPPTVDFSDESDPDEREQVFPDKTKMARLKRRSRADQDQDQDQDEQPISTIPTMMTARPVTNKKRKVTSGSGITPEEREKMARTSERLKKDAQRLPVNEGEPESLVFVTSLTPGPVSIWGTRLGHWILIPGRIYDIIMLIPAFLISTLHLSLSLSNLVLNPRLISSSHHRQSHLHLNLVILISSSHRIDWTSNSDPESEHASGSQPEPEPELGSRFISISISIAKDALVQHILDNETVVVSTTRPSRLSLLSAFLALGLLGFLAFWLSAFLAFWFFGRLRIARK